MQWPVGHDQRAYTRAQQTFETRVHDFIFSQCGTHIHLEFENYNLQSIKLVHKCADLYVPNALKLTYEHLYFRKFSRGYIYKTPLRGWEDSVGKGREGLRHGC